MTDVPLQSNKIVSNEVKTTKCYYSHLTKRKEKKRKERKKKKTKLFGQPNRLSKMYETENGRI